MEAGQDVFLDIDVQGAMQIKAAAADDALLRRVADFIFIAPPSAAVLEARLRGRASDSEEQIALRLATSRRELEFWREYDFLVVNADLETAVDEITAIIRSVRLRTAKITEGFPV
ncbi:Guanylate kinase [bioreactor metagenome]|uniref:Guanylate kinase n=1 Tax=bioreactor metagenome TaxID=1076179 RepID=A0A645F0I6_9ZZZZ